MSKKVEKNCLKNRKKNHTQQQERKGGIEKNERQKHSKNNRNRELP
jgi:hypothetical protein